MAVIAIKSSYSEHAFTWRQHPPPSPLMLKKMKQSVVGLFFLFLAPAWDSGTLRGIYNIYLTLPTIKNKGGIICAPRVPSNRLVRNIITALYFEKKNFFLTPAVLAYTLLVLSL